MTKCNFCGKELTEIYYKKVFNEKLPCCRLCCAKYSNKQLEKFKMQQLIKEQTSKIIGKEIPENISEITNSNQ